MSAGDLQYTWRWEASSRPSSRSSAGVGTVRGACKRECKESNIFKLIRKRRGGGGAAVRGWRMDGVCIERFLTIHVHIHTHAKLWIIYILIYSFTHTQSYELFTHSSTHIKYSRVSQVCEADCSLACAVTHTEHKACFCFCTSVWEYADPNSELGRKYERERKRKKREMSQPPIHKYF